MIARLRAVALLLVGYGFCWADRAYGYAPILLLALVAAVSWLAGAAYLTAAVATAQRERDDACAIAVSLHEGATYQPLPSYIDRAEADRLNRHLRPVGDAG